jgi:hypothetical protein
MVWIHWQCKYCTKRPFVDPLRSLPSQAGNHFLSTSRFSTCALKRDQRRTTDLSKLYSPWLILVNPFTQFRYPRSQRLKSLTCKIAILNFQFPLMTNTVFSYSLNRLLTFYLHKTFSPKISSLARFGFLFHLDTRQCGVGNMAPPCCAGVPFIRLYYAVPGKVLVPPAAHPAPTHTFCLTQKSNSFTLSNLHVNSCTLIPRSSTPRSLGILSLEALNPRLSRYPRR